MNYRSINALIAAVTLAGLGQMAHAGPPWYECDLKAYGSGFPAPKPYYFAIDVANGKGLAIGPWIYEFNNEQPIEAALSKRGANGYRIQYVLEVEFRGNFSSHARFDVTYYANKANLMMSVDYPGFDNHGMGARGRCKPAKPKS